jgi:[ribosomal protein S5]-alanine N-acetyltransferase
LIDGQFEPVTAPKAHSGNTFRSFVNAMHYDDPLMAAQYSSQCRNNLFQYHHMPPHLPPHLPTHMPPQTLLETPRLRLIRFTDADAPFVQSLMMDRDWIANIGDFNIKTAADAEARMRLRYFPQWEKYGYGACRVDRKEDGAQMGMCGLFRREGLDEADLGFAFLPAYRGHGYAIEAANAVVAYARDVLHLSGVLGVTLPTNKSSITILERAGLTFRELTRLTPDDDELALYDLRF